MELSLEAAERQIAHLNGIINAQRRYTALSSYMEHTNIARILT